MALANHHDNFDLYDSKYQSWNSTKLGPKKDLVGGWAKAAKEHGLPFGVSVHASTPGHGMKLPSARIKPDHMPVYLMMVSLTKADGAGKWWNGYDPQELYAQNHALSQDSLDDGSMGIAIGIGAMGASTQQSLL
jgi:alpha-L-fucosidase